MASRAGRGDRRQQQQQQQQQQAQTPTAAGRLAEAEALQQRAERRRGQEAVVALDGAAAAFRAALAAPGLDAQLAADAQFGLAECLQLCAERMLEQLQQAPDAELARGLASEVQAEATERLRASVQAYEQVPAAASDAAAGAAALRVDAAVNAGNALCSWAALAGDRQLLARAVELYQAALQQEEDAATLSNLGDAQVALGELELAAGRAAAGQAAFEAAVQAYQRSCSLSDSTSGDDLPGLLHNWGVGLHTISKHARDPQLQRSLLEQAADKLRSSAGFSRADVEPHNALGDVLLDAAELVVGTGGAGAAGEPLPGAVAEQAACLIKDAVDQGFQAALTINRSNADALVGLAEASVALGRLAWRQGDQAAGAAHMSAAVQRYQTALQRPQLLGDAASRADVRYNAACAAAMAGQAGLAQELLQVLAATPGALQAAALTADEDWAAVRGCAWFQDLLARATG